MRSWAVYYHSEACSGLALSTHLNIVRNGFTSLNRSSEYSSCDSQDQDSHQYPTEGGIEARVPSTVRSEGCNARAHHQSYGPLSSLLLSETYSANPTPCPASLLLLHTIRSPSSIIIKRLLFAFLYCCSVSLLMTKSVSKVINHHARSGNIADFNRLRDRVYDVNQSSLGHYNHTTSSATPPTSNMPAPSTRLNQPFGTGMPPTSYTQGIHTFFFLALSRLSDLICSQAQFPRFAFLFDNGALDIDVGM